MFPGSKFPLPGFHRFSRKTSASLVSDIYNPFDMFLRLELGVSYTRVIDFLRYHLGHTTIILLPFHLLLGWLLFCLSSFSLSGFIYQLFNDVS